jgi:hypothetical protein
MIVPLVITTVISDDKYNCTPSHPPIFYYICKIYKRLKKGFHHITFPTVAGTNMQHNFPTSFPEHYFPNFDLSSLNLGAKKSMHSDVHAQKLPSSACELFNQSKVFLSLPPHSFFMLYTFDTKLL